MVSTRSAGKKAAPPSGSSPASSSGRSPGGKDTQLAPRKLATAPEAAADPLPAGSGLLAAVEARRLEREAAAAPGLLRHAKLWLWRLKFRYNLLLGNYIYSTEEATVINLLVLLVVALLLFGAFQQLKLLSALPAIIRQRMAPASA